MSMTKFTFTITPEISENLWQYTCQTKNVQIYVLSGYKND